MRNGVMLRGVCQGERLRYEKIVFDIEAFSMLTTGKAEDPVIREKRPKSAYGAKIFGIDGSVKEIEGNQVIVISVEEAKEKPVFAFGRAYKRVGRSTLRMSKNEIERVILEKRRVYWDEQICEDASLEDIDEKKVEWYLESREEIRKVKKPREMDFRTLLLK